MARLASYTVHVPPAKPGQDADEATQFVPDSFSPVAFVVPWAWLLWNRMWLAFIAYLVLMTGVAVALAYSGFPPPLRMAITFAISLLVGLEATNLKRRTLRRRGFREVGVVVARNREEAERRYFAERDGAAPRASYVAASAPQAPLPAAAHPIGFFPEADPGARPR